MTYSKLLASIAVLFLVGCGIFTSEKDPSPSACKGWEKDSLVVAEILRINGMTDSAITAWAAGEGLPVKCVDDRVVELQAYYLDSMGTKIGFDSIPPEIGALSELADLGGYRGGVSTIPIEIGLLNHLRVLNLTEHRISKLPKSMESLTKLEELRLSNNTFDSFPIELCNMDNLTKLSFSGNFIYAFPPSCTGMNDLEVLNLDFNALTEFPTGLLDLPKSTSVFISHNRICSPIPDSLQMKIRAKGWDRLIESNQDCR